MSKVWQLLSQSGQTQCMLCNVWPLTHLYEYIYLWMLPHATFRIISVYLRSLSLLHKMFNEMQEILCLPLCLI